MGFPLHKPYSLTYSLHRWVPPFLEIFDEWQLQSNFRKTSKKCHSRLRTLYFRMCQETTSNLFFYVSRFFFGKTSHEQWTKQNLREYYFINHDLKGSQFWNNQDSTEVPMKQPLFITERSKVSFFFFAWLTLDSWLKVIVMNLKTLTFSDDTDANMTFPRMARRGEDFNEELVDGFDGSSWSKVWVF